MRILSVDDDPAMGQLIARVAARAAIAIEVTESAGRFIEAFRARRPDGVILDLQIGGEDGIELLRFLSGESFTGRILLLSGLDERLLQAAARLGREHGLRMAGILTKPARVGAIKEALRKLQPEGVWAPSAAEIGEAIKAGDLALFLQPIVDGGSRAVASAEALLRWQHPRQGLITPGRFLPVAEAEPALIDELTLWVAAEASRHQRRMAGAGLDVPVAVNVSGANLRNLGFADRLAGAVLAAGGEAGRISIELTETAAFQNALNASDILLRLRIKGFDIALDDFGTGFSSLQLLREIPFSALKVAQPFVADVLESRDAAAIVGATIDLARRLELRSIAEGVETEEVAVAVAGLGADAMQGHLFGPPMDVATLIARCQA